MSKFDGLILYKHYVFLRHNVFGLPSGNPEDGLTYKSRHLFLSSHIYIFFLGLYEIIFPIFYVYF